MAGADAPKSLLQGPPQDSTADAIADFFACVREKRRPVADVKLGAIAALTAIMGREAIYKRRMVTWKELGVTV